MQKYSVSFYQPNNLQSTCYGKNATNTTKDLVTICKDIQTGVYKEVILKLHSLPGLEAKTQKTFLPGFTPSGVFAQRKADFLREHSNIICLDFDDLENPTDIKDALSLDKWVLAAFISPLGKGVKAFVRIDGIKHLDSFKSLANYYELQLGVRVDESGKDVSRLCFVSYDPDLYLNEAATVYQFQALASTAQKSDTSDKNKPQLLQEIETITKRVEAASIDITNNYKDWLKLGFALATTLKEDGRQYFHRLSVFSAKYSPDLANKQYDECLKDKNKGVGINSFFYLCKSNNVNINIAASPSPGKPQKNASKPSFKNSYGEEITDRERIENAILEIFEIRRNIILDRVECKEIEAENPKWEAANEDDISRELELKRVKNCSPARIKSIINSKFVKPFNPFKQYFENLPAYNKKTEPDYIQQLADIVQLKDEATDRTRFNNHFKKALVRCVACSLADGINNLNYNKHAIIFISPKMSIGKSGFVRFLIPNDLEMYCVENMSFGNRDEDFTMQSSFIINLDEMAKIDERNLQSVKTAMSKGIINVRKMNSGQRIIEPRRCNFWGTTNETHILKDDTGSVRWLCFEVDGFNKDAEYWKPESNLFVDMDKVWSMAYTLFKSGFEFQLSNKEIQENEIANEQYKEASIEEQLLKTHFKPAAKEKDNHKTTIEILSHLKLLYPALSNNINLTKLGSALKNNGFAYGQEYDKAKGFQIKGYYAMQFV